MPILTLENLHKRLGRRDVIRGLTMTVEPGEVYGFVGPNGAGKTTTIRMMVGLIRPSAGRVTIGGFDVQHQRSHALAQVGAIVENPETYSYLSGRQNLMQYARLAGVADAGLRIDEVTEQVRLKDRIDDKVKNYSLGMRQRLGVAQALLARPKLLVLDEPTNGLDPAGMREFRQLMRDLADQGMAVFVSSHLLGELEQVCDRIGVIQQGELIVEEGMAALKARSGNTIVVDLSPTSAGKGADLGMAVPVNESGASPAPAHPHSVGVQAAVAALSQAGFIAQLSGALPGNDMGKGQGTIANDGEKISPLQLRLEAQNRDIPRVVRILVEAGVDIYGVVSEQGSLEEAFLALTQRGSAGAPLVGKQKKEGLNRG